MAENPFDLYDEAAPTVTPTGPATEDDNPFSAFDGEQPPQPKAPASQPPAPPTPVQNMPGVSVIDDAEMRDFLDAFEAQNMRDGTDKLNEARGRGFIDGITDPQQYLEYGKGLPGTALDTVVGRPLRAAGTYKTAGEINAGEFQRRQISTFDRIDRGERIADMDDPVGYQHMTPAQRQLARAQVERAAAVYAATPVKEQALHKAGEAVQKYSKTILPAIPGYEDSVGRQLGEGSGSLLGSIATGVVGRVLGVGSGLMVATSAMGGTSEAVDRAIEFDRKERAAGRAGLTDADFVSVGISGVGPGATDLVPLEFLLRRLKLPPEVTKATARVIARIGGQAFIEGIQEGGQQFWQNEIARERYDPSQSLTEGVLPNMAFGGGVGAIAQASKELGQFALRRFAGRRASGSAGQPSGQPTAPGVAPRAAASPDQAPSQATKAPSSQPEAAPTPTIRRDAAPETRAAAREQFNQYLALEERLAVIPDDVDAPPELINEAIDAEEAMVEAFRATGLPGDNLARGTRPINSMDDVRRAFDEATPEEINEFWQGKAVGPAASGAVVGAGATAQGDATGQVRTAAPVEEGGPGSAPAEPSPTLRLEKSAGNATVYDAMIDDVVHAQVSIKLHPKDKSIEVLSIGSDRKQGKLKPEFVGKIKAALVQQFPDYETAFGQEVGESAPLRPSAHDLTTDFLRLIATPAPRDQWAQTLGVSEDELMPHVERAIASGLLRVDRNGVARRNASAVTAMEPETEAENQKIEDAVASGAGPLLAPGIISGESVTLTPKALGKIQQLQAIAEKAVAKILPRDVRIDVVDTIKIARLAREDELLSLRSSKSAKVTEGTEGESDEAGLREGSTSPGQKSNDASQSADAGAVAATVGGGGASGASAREGRILRQESATLRDDGSVFAGRVAGAERPADAGARDGRESQPFGRTEAFAAPAGYTGYVTADAPFSHARLDAIGAPKSQYRLATLAYRVYHEGTRLPNPNADPRAQLGSGLIHARISQHMDGTWEVAWVQRLADPDVFPKNMSDLLYAAIEKDLGVRLSPSGLLSPAGLKMWQRRSPESVKWHQWSKREGYFVSPRRIKDNLAKIGMDLADIAARPDSDPDKAFAHASAMAERKELIALWTKLPLEARGATPNTMFSLRAYHGTPHEFDRFDLGKIGTGEGAQVFGHGLYFAENEGVAKAYQEALSPFVIDGNAVDGMMLGTFARMKHEGKLDEIASFEADYRDRRARLVEQDRNAELEAEKTFSTPDRIRRQVAIALNDIDAQLANIERVRNAKDVTRSGSLYEVDIDVEPHQLLDHDAKLADQPEMLAKTAALLKQVGSDVTPESLRTQHGSWVYSELQAYLGSADAASQALKDAGIPGLRYRDQGSRFTEHGGTRNIVIFDDSLITITKKNGEPVTAQERQDVVDQMLSLRSEPEAIEQVRDFGEQRMQAIGQADPIAQTISLGVRAIEAEAAATGKTEERVTIEGARHEAFEYLLHYGVIQPNEWKALTETAVRENWIAEIGTADAYAEQNKGMPKAELDALILKEAIMEKFGRYERGEYQPNGTIAKVFKRIKDFLDRLRSGLKGAGFQRWEDIFQKMEEGEMRRRYDAIYGAPAAESKGRATSKAAPAGDRIAAMTLPGLAPNAPLSPAPAGPTPGRAASAPGSLVDIQRNLRRKLGLTVASGRLDPAASRAAGKAGGKLMGQFDRRTEVIRLRTLQDIDTESHEVAHALENRYAGIANLQQAHVQELDGVANLTGQSGLSEGFAEFFRLYLTNPPAADAHAPRFRAAFEDFIETEDAQVLQDIQEIQAQYQQWRDASSAGRITAAIKSGVPEGTWEKIESDYQKGGMTRIRGRFSAFLDRVYKNVFDKTNPIRVLVQRIAEHAQRTNQDIDLSAWRNPHVQAGKIPLMDSAAYMDITRGVGWANSAGHGSVSLNDALATAFGGRGFENWTPEQRDAFGAYLIARRGRWLWQRHDMDPARNRGRMANPPLNPQNGDWYFDTMARQRRVYLRGRWEAELTRAPDKHSRADHEMTVAEMEAANPQFAVAAQMVYQFNRDLALKRFQAGLDSQEEFDYKNGATDYVPWFRDMTDRIFSGTAASGRKVQGKFKIRGSYRDFINPVEGIIRQVYDTNREIAVNKPKLLLAQLADGVKGAGQFAEIIPATRMEVQEVRVRDALAQAAREEGIPPEDAKNMISAVAAMIGDDAVAKIFKSKQAGDGGDAILHYMDGGELKMLQLHDDEYGLARDIIGFFEVVKHTPAADGLFKMIAVIARLPQKFITSSIEFAYNNLIRDTMTASVLQAGFVPVASQAQTIRDNRAKRARGEETWGEILARHGGIMGGLNTTHIRMARQGRILDLGAEGAKYMPWDYRFWTRTVNDGFWNVIEAPEGMTRQTLARLSFDRALKDVQTTYPSMPADQQTFVALETAVQKSRDYADYSRMGDLPSILGFVKLVPFLNPALQGTDKSARAVFRAQDAQGQYQAAEILRKKIAPLFDPEWLIKQRKPGGPGFKNLTKAQVGALKGAAYAWVGICIIAVTHLMIEILFNDEDELEDKSQLERATSVSFTINGIGYRIPRGFDIINVVSNAVRATYASWKREDPTAWKQFRQTLGASLMPPTSSPLLDLYIGWKHERNNFFNSPIEQEHQQGLLPEDRYTAYTSNLSRRISEIANPAMPFDVSPVMVEYSMNAIGSQWSRDILRTYDVFDPSKPAIKWQDYPFIRGARGLRGSRGAEEFWDLMGQEGKFAQAAGSYTTKEAKNWDRDSIRKFFDVRLKDDDAKAYAIMKRHYDPEQRRLHPLIRAHEMTAAVSGVMRDVSSNNITVAITSKIERKPEISREVRGQAMDILAEINRREYRNALIALKRPGYENRNPQPVKPYLQELKALSPDIHRALMGKINKSKGPTVYDYDRVREAWPEVRRKVLSPEKRERIIESEGDVEFSDLLGRAQGPKAMGIR